MTFRNPYKYQVVVMHISEKLGCEETEYFFFDLLHLREKLAIVLWRDSRCQSHRGDGLSDRFARPVFQLVWVLHHLQDRSVRIQDPVDT
jgi:hypothetical protein